MLVVIPFIAGWFAIRLTKAYFIEPTALPRLLSWVLQAIAVSVAASFGASRALAFLTPLPALLTMTLVFPDRAPSRFGLALRSGTTRKLLDHQDFQLSSDTQEAAEQAIVLVDQLSAHERLTRGHTERVRAYADLIGQQLGLDAAELNRLRWGTLLHDVGKLNVPAKILRKPGAPTDDEWAILRQHPAEAVSMLEPFEPWLGRWVLAASQHHERWDGTGYPLGLSGTDISLPGRITAVADAYDVITSRRSYKEPVPLEEARRELVASAGTHFDPAVVRAMLEVGLDEQHRTNPFGWLLEIPGLTRAIEVGVAAPLAAVAAVVVAGASVLSPPPADLALVTPSTTTVSAPTSTVSDTAPITTETVPETSTPSTTVPPTTTTSVTTTQPPTTAATTAPTTSTPTTTTPTTAAPTTAAPTTAAPTTTEPLIGCEGALAGETDQPGADLVGCDFSGLTIDGLNFSNGDLRNTNFTNAVVQNFELSGANLMGATLTGASFTDGTFASAAMSNVDGTALSLTRVNLSSVTWSGARLDDAVLSEIGSTGGDFSSASFQRANVSTSQLADATFTDADFSNATFSSVSFDRSNLTRTTFLGASFDSVTGGGAVHQDTVCTNGNTTNISCF